MMSEATDRRSVQCHEPIRGDEIASPSGGPAPDPAPLLLTSGRTIQITAGVQQRERVVTDEAGLEQRELIL